jgi:predicted DCC family thiol-disulfide oxidoreductase YuxK
MRAALREAFSYRGDPDVPAFPDDRPIIIFDGKCAMCSMFAQRVIRRDRRGMFRLLAAQSELGAALYRHYGLDPASYETNMLLESGRAWFKSEASIRILSRLGFPWTCAAAARALPFSWRERVYDFIARNRLKWFGVRERCYVPRVEDADRFL